MRTLMLGLDVEPQALNPKPDDMKPLIVWGFRLTPMFATPEIRLQARTGSVMKVWRF